jgi:glutamate 5-kinase
MVAPLVAADLLVLLTDVEGLLDANKQRISVVSDFDAIEKLIWPKDNAVSVGGMSSKVSAARQACQVGVPVVIAPARDPDVLRKVVSGEDFGTLFLPAGASLASRKYWIAYTLKMRGTLVIDAGAQRAVTEQNRSLLPAGIVEVRGTFRAGDAVSVVAPDGRELARGLSRRETHANDDCPDTMAQRTQPSRAPRSSPRSRGRDRRGGARAQGAPRGDHRRPRQSRLLGLRRRDEWP